MSKVYIHSRNRSTFIVYDAPGGRAAAVINQPAGKYLGKVRSKVTSGGVLWIKLAYNKPRYVRESDITYRNPQSALAAIKPGTEAFGAPGLSVIKAKNNLNSPDFISIPGDRFIGTIAGIRSSARGTLVEVRGSIVPQTLFFYAEDILSGSTVRQMAETAKRNDQQIFAAGIKILEKRKAILGEKGKAADQYLSRLMQGYQQRQKDLDKIAGLSIQRKLENQISSAWTSITSFFGLNGLGALPALAWVGIVAAASLLVSFVSIGLYRWAVRSSVSSGFDLKKIKAYERCVNSANTEQDLEKCRTGLKQQVEDFAETQREDAAGDTLVGGIGQGLKWGLAAIALALGVNAFRKSK